jgi:hypothetical protein
MDSSPTENFLSGVQDVCRMTGTLLMLPLVYHVVKGTNILPNPALAFSTVTGLGLITGSLLPIPPPVVHGQSSLKMMADTVGYLGKVVIVTSIGLSLMKTQRL